MVAVWWLSLVLLLTLSRVEDNDQEHPLHRLVLTAVEANVFLVSSLATWLEVAVWLTGKGERMIEDSTARVSVITGKRCCSLSTK